MLDARIASLSKMEEVVADEHMKIYLHSKSCRFIDHRGHLNLNLNLNTLRPGQPDSVVSVYVAWLKVRGGGQTQKRKLR